MGLERGGWCSSGTVLRQAIRSFCVPDFERVGVTTRKCANCPVREAAGDARGAQQFELKHDFQGAGGALKVPVCRKVCFTAEIRQSSGCFSPRSVDQVLSAVSSSRSIGREFHAKCRKFASLGSLEPDNSDTFVSSPPLASGPIERIQPFVRHNILPMEALSILSHVRIAHFS